ncbi:MAG: class I SAM-dependent methyltransferase [Phycisphaerae bacterium]|jgi:2-polyprenyl-3-methyl-5-hydroxy-6-metoxy-1,4-benzoquinol methylase
MSQGKCRVGNYNVKENDIRPKAIFDEYLKLSREDIDIYFRDRTEFLNVNCPACQSAKVHSSFTKDSFTYLECECCETLYVSPRPPQKMIDGYYKNSESSKYWATTFYKETEAVRREKLYRPKAQMIKSIVIKNGITPGALLDIGAGYGTLCEELKALNFFKEVFAMEPSIYLSEVCRKKGLNVIESTIEKIDGENEAKFDIAVSLELFEHLFSVDSFLDAVSRALKPGGFFIFSTLSGTGWDILVLREHSNSVSPPHHVNFLNPHSIELLAERKGWRVVDLFTPGELDVDIVVNFARYNPSFELDRFTREILASGEKIQNAFQKFLVENRLSSHMWIVLQKQ